MNNIELYIENTNGDYVSIDIFGDENIQVEDSIQDVRDISKIFNTFTRDFKVPASFDNNKLFKHYYNLNIDNGFDARIKTKALIKVGGVDYKEGYLRLLSVGLNNNKPSFYKVTFQGLITSLKDVLQDDEVKDLDYSQLQFSDTRAKRVEGIRTGLYRNGSAEQDANGNDLYPDLIYAPIFTKGKVVAVPFYPDLNSNLPLVNNGYQFSLTKFTGIGKTNTLVSDSGSKYHDPITIYDYKPSIKVGLLLRMIGEQYGLRFTKDFYQLEELDQLYMHFNGVKETSEVNDSNNAFNSNIGNNTSLDSTTINIVEYTSEDTPPSGVSKLSGTFDNKYVAISGSEGQKRMEYTKGLGLVTWSDPTTTPPVLRMRSEKFFRNADGTKDVVMYRNYTEQWIGIGYTYMSSDGRFSPWDDLDYYNANHNGRTLEVGVVITSDFDISSLVYEMEYKHCTAIVINQFGATSRVFTTHTTAPTSIASNSFLNIGVNAPKIKLIDLLLGIFKTFNLTSYIDSSGDVQVLPLRDYYANGKTLNITQYVDIDSHNIENGFVYRNVTMKHEEPEDVLTKNYTSSEVGVEYGDIRVNKESFLGDAELVDSTEVVDGKDYNIQSPFARMMFENLALAVNSSRVQTNGKYSISDGGLPTDIVIGNCIDDKLEGIETKPILFYGKQVDTQASYSPSASNPASISEIGGRVLANYTERGNMAGAYGAAVFGRKLVMVQNGAVSTHSDDYVSDDVLKSDDLTTNLGFVDSSKWWNPSGIMASRYRRDGETLMNFYAKFNSFSFDGGQAYDEFEYPNGLASDQWIVGLYQNNYEDYLDNLYQKNSRISKFKVQLPNSIITSYGLNDTLIVGTNEYNINKIKVDLLSGKGQVELINKIEIPVVEVQENIGEIVQSQITGLNLLPASGNYLYNTSIVTKSFNVGTPEEEVQNVNQYGSTGTKSDATLALDRMQSDFPNLESVSVIVTWYGDTDNPDMVIKPRLDLDDGGPVYNIAWASGSYDRTNTPEVTINAEGKANHGGTPGDSGIIEFIGECNTRGIKVMVYPFLQMDTVDKGWRGMIPFTSKSEVDTWWLQYEPFIRHYSQLLASSGLTVDKFMIGTELVTLTRYNDNGQYHGVAHLAKLAEDVRSDFGVSNSVQISYGANWDEYHSHDQNYHMDELWTSPYIDAIGIDNYFPATDFQTPSTITYQDIYDGYEKGEGWDHYYSVYSSDPSVMLPSKVDYPIAGGEFAWKNIFGWWDRNHTAHSYTTTATPTLGSELLTSPDFGSISWPWNYGSWSYIPSPSVSGGIATLPISGGSYPTVNPRIEQTIVTISGETYTVEVDVNDAQGITIQALTVDPNNGFAYLNGDTQTFATNGILSFDFVATSAGTTIQILVQGVDGDSVEINSASVKQQIAGSGTTITNTAWTARMKPLFFAEYGFASVDGTSNQPNVFAPGLPRMSNSLTDFNAQRIGLRAFNDYWDDKTVGVTGFAEDRYAWAYDLRPYPQFPNAGIWEDSPAWEKGHWINGKLV